MKTILIAVPTNKYIEPETMKAIYDLEVPEGYRTEFQFFYGYARSQVKNLIAEWGKNYDYTLVVSRTAIFDKNTLSNIFLSNTDIFLDNKLMYFCVSKNTFLNIQYPHFLKLETEEEEIKNFIDRAKVIGMSTVEI